MAGKTTRKNRKLTPPERPRLNIDEVNFVLDLNAQIVGALGRIQKLEIDVAELQAEVLVKP